METGESSESPNKTKKGKTKTKAAKKPEASSLKQKSPAEFFAENKNIAGFDNVIASPGKCLYTTVRELVENSLDSVESISELPVVQKRFAKEARDQEIQEKNVALGKKVKETSAVKARKGCGEASFYRVTCEDNGRGMPHDDIPNMLGRGSDLVKDEYRPSDRD